MGGDSQSVSATSAAGESGRAAQALQDLSFPAIQSVIAQYMADLGTPGSESASVKNLFSQARNSLGSNFNSAELSNSQAIATRAKAMGLDYRPDATQAAQSQAMMSLEQQRASALQNLSFQESQYGMNQTNQLLARMGAIERGLAGAGAGFGVAANSELGMLPQTSPWMGALGGAASGAGAGASFGPWGAVIGGVVGGGLGYLGSGG